nr:MAG TPA_asm: hypothetical protein [Caudoviricetes sp.]DAS69733.1 MAG TPA: hypothetical protein [Caudoviricetes sp.]
MRLYHYICDMKENDKNDIMFDNSLTTIILL